MAVDALDPGPNGDYPHWPRRPDGSLDPERMPTGVHGQRVGDKRVLIDVTPSDENGNAIVPPTRPA